MALIETEIASTLIRSKKSGYFAEHNGSHITHRGQGILLTPRNLICADTEAEVDGEITRLNLAPIPLTPRQRAAAAFATLPSNVQGRFAAAFQALTAVPDSALIVGVTAIQVTPEDQQYKDLILAALN